MEAVHPLNSAFILREILLKIELSELRACLKVTRFWFTIAAPLIWSDPTCQIKLPLPFNVFVRSLDCQLTTKISDCQLTTETSKPLLLPYASYLKVLHYSWLIQSIEDDIVKNDYEFIKMPLGKRDNYLTARILELTEPILKTLSTRVKLISLRIYAWDLKINEVIYSLLFKFPTLISCITELGIASNSGMVKVLDELSMVCHRITMLTATLSNNDHNRDFGETEITALKKLIQSQSCLTTASITIYPTETYGNNVVLLLPTIHSLEELLLVIDYLTVRLLKTGANFCTVIQTKNQKIIKFERSLADFHGNSLPDLTHLLNIVDFQGDRLPIPDPIPGSTQRIYI
ncbi:10653_t:CDS:1 [Paraglomus brasilianum]|uniref:10653_t:CDS:1 n=1 Tax=Paraglomus brasilianum TaxID=144538 RepID=A0A9N9A293_9GLOM|nr:10653_t:CDS:1 [Paraglomus brasilianum]